MVANLDDSHENAHDFRQIIRFLRKCELSKAIASDPEIFEDHIRGFWNTAEVQFVNGRRSIVATVMETRIEIDLPIIRHVLGLLDNGNTNFSEADLRQTYQRMGCEGDVISLKLIKKNVSYQWRYLWHVVIHCIAGRKAGWDTLNMQLASGIAALCTGRPFDWAKVIFNNMISNISASARNKFLMYPRFIQMIIDSRMEQIPHTGATLQLHEMTDAVWKHLKAERAQSGFSGLVTPLFPYMIELIEEHESAAEEEEVQAEQRAEQEAPIQESAAEETEVQAPQPAAEEIEEEEEEALIRRPSKRRRRSPRIQSIPTQETSERRSKHRNDPHQPQNETIKEIRMMKVSMISALHEIKDQMKAQTSAITEQNKLIKSQNAILKKSLKTITKELTMIRRRRQDSSESSSSSDEDSEDDEYDDNDESPAPDDDERHSKSEDDDDESPNVGDTRGQSQHNDQETAMEIDSDSSDSVQVHETEPQSKQQSVVPESTQAVDFQTENLTDIQLFDAQTDVSTLTNRQIKDFLHRHGWKRKDLKDMTLDDMRSEAVKIQFDLISKLPASEQASIQHDLMVTPRDYDIRARFNPARRPQPSRHRIVHWRYDDIKDCFLVKRVTGDTQVFYSTCDLTRLTEEDLRELTDLPLHNIGDDSKARAFERFLRNTKKDNFEAISKNKTILKPETDRYLRRLGLTPREVIKEQFLALKAEHVPVPNVTSQLNKFVRWYLDERTYEMVIEREDEENIRIYHPAEFNQFNKTNLQILSENQPEGK